MDSQIQQRLLSAMPTRGGKSKTKIDAYIFHARLIRDGHQEILMAITDR
jgi:hypothetical protein